MVYNELMGVEPEPLPDASDLISGLDEMLRGGGKLFSDRDLNSSDEKIPPSEDEKYFMDILLRSSFPQIPTEHPRELARGFLNSFSSRKRMLIEEMHSAGRVDEAHAGESITLGKLADFAKEKHEAFGKDAGGLEINSREFQNSRTFAEYWSRLEEITRSASELQNGSNSSY